MSKTAWALGYGVAVFVGVILVHFLQRHIRMDAALLLAFVSSLFATCAVFWPRAGFWAGLAGMTLVGLNIVIQHPEEALSQTGVDAWFFFNLHFVPMLLPYLLSTGYFNLFSKAGEKR